MSTPETGEYVRFDIRPLQEFFAAEHIYQSGEPGVFIERVRVIAGDSHWREVIHFLLSALIENNRKNELAAAITVLMEIDDGEQRDLRVLNRRLARGGIVAARLLQEGVLEQDKRIREQFRNSILPLLGCPDADFYLSDIRSNHTLQWLNDVLVVSLREQAEFETIGAAVTLTRFLRDSDVRAQEVKRALLGASTAYQAFVLDRLGTDLEARMPQWLAEFSLMVLLKEGWWQLGEAAVKTALNILAQFPETIKDIAITCGVNSEIARISAALLFPDQRTTFSTGRPKGQPNFSETRYGIVEVSYFKPKEALNWKAWSPQIWSSLEESSGVLHAAYCVFNLFRTPTAKSLKAYLASIGGTPYNSRLLPESMNVFIGDNGSRRAAKKLSPRDLLERRRAGVRHQSF